ncbi:MAG TPA: haloacid dehalogenase-like hydrolase, partial [Microlunatus sp.]
MTEILPSWRPGPTRDALLAFLERAATVPVEDRVAYFDNDGTLWCERPTYVQYDFFVDVLQQRVAVDPGVADRAEFAALIGGDPAAIEAVGLSRIAAALAGLFEGQTPQEFAAVTREFMVRAEHRTLARPLRTLVYQPMLELIGELRRLDFSVGIVTGGGTEFVRAISQDLYGVPPELVVGTRIGYRLSTDAAGSPELRRTADVAGEANEGAAKVSNIQSQLGRRPMLAAGNSGGDREMLAWAAGAPGGLGLLIDHDDVDREFAYRSLAVTVDEAEPITVVAERQGWTVASMARDWVVVFETHGDSLTALAAEQLVKARQSHSGRAAHTVYGGHGHALRQTVIALAAGHELAEHESPGEATLQVLIGRVRLTAGDVAWEGGPGGIVAIPPARHALAALE